MCKDPIKGLEDIISVGCHRLLTSGQKRDAYSGKDLISTLNKQSNGRISVVPACGINQNNISDIQKATGCSEFHRNKDVSMGGATAVSINEYAKTLSSADVIRETRALVDELP